MAMAKKTFEPVEETFHARDPYGTQWTREITCRLADDGLRITVYPRMTIDADSGRRVILDSSSPRKTHLSPARCLEVLGGQDFTENAYEQGSAAVTVYGNWSIRVYARDCRCDSAAVFDMFTMAKWLDCVAFPEEEEMHRRLWEELRFHRASHLISPPIEKKPEPDPIQFAPIEADEIIEADFEQAEPVATTSLVIAEHQVEPTQQESITGLGLRRFVRSGLLFARDVAVDVTSRIVSRSLTGQ